MELNSQFAQRLRLSRTRSYCVPSNCACLSFGALRWKYGRSRRKVEEDSDGGKRGSMKTIHKMLTGGILLAAGVGLLALPQFAASPEGEPRRGVRAEAPE